MEEVFDITTPNPWTISVPETQAFSFINSIDASRQIAQGNYDSGAERGTVTVSLDQLASIGSDDMVGQYVLYLVVSNQAAVPFTTWQPLNTILIDNEWYLKTALLLATEYP